jgi:dTDP-4-amino-4,6-dideoxygalactose transaminase
MERIERSLETGRMLQGEAVRDLERSVAAQVGRRYAVAVNSCTDGLFFALRASGLKPGDEVLVPDLSFVATASAVVRASAAPMFVDVDDSYNLNLDAARERVTPRTRGIVFVHLYGQMGDPRRIETFARDHGLILIEDAAQAFGASFTGRIAGSLGSASCFSFDPTKPISAVGSGGMVLTDDDEIAARVRRLRYHGRAPDGDFVELGFNSQMSSLVAAVLGYKLEHNDAWLERRREIAASYIRRLSRLPLVLPVERVGAVHAYHKFVVRCRDRDDLKALLERAGIETMVHYPKPLHGLSFLKRGEGRPGSDTKAEHFTRHVLSLPIHPFLSDGEVSIIADTIERFCATNVESGLRRDSRSELS